MSSWNATVIKFTDIMVSLLKSGLSLQQSIQICMDVEPSKENKDFCSHILEELIKGNKLNKAIEDFPRKCPRMYVPLIEIGEESGNILNVFEKLSVYLHRKDSNNKKLIQNMVYPIMVVVTAFFVIACILFFVFPRLKSLFEVFMESSDVVADKVNNIYVSLYTSMIFVVAFFSLLLIVFLLYKTNDKCTYFIDSCMLNIPFLKDYLLIKNTSDFCFSMELLCSSGITMVDALEKSSAVVNNLRYRDAILSSKSLISGGMKISQAFSSQDLFPPYFISWLKIGENTGNVTNVFTQIQQYYDGEYNSKIMSIFSYIEPLFILVTGIFIFILIGQFVLPIFSLLGAL